MRSFRIPWGPREPLKECSWCKGNSLMRLAVLLKHLRSTKSSGALLGLTQAASLAARFPNFTGGGINAN